MRKNKIILARGHRDPGDIAAPQNQCGAVNNH